LTLPLAPRRSHAPQRPRRPRRQCITHLIMKSRSMRVTGHLALTAAGATCAPHIPRIGMTHRLSTGLPRYAGPMSTTAPTLRIHRAGVVDYLTAWEEQRRLHAAVADGQAPDTVLLLEHPSVYTAGK